MTKRLFIGIPIEADELTVPYNIWINDPELNQNKINWVRPANWHLTLHFLGDISLDLIDDIKYVVEGAVNDFKPFDLSIEGTGVFPDNSNPKILWLGAKGIEPVIPVYEIMKTGLDKLRVSFDRKELNPHITVGRIKHINNKDVIVNLLQSSENKLFGMLRVEKIVLYESTLTPGGAVYKPLFETGGR